MNTLLELLDNFGQGEKEFIHKFGVSNIFGDPIGPDTLPEGAKLFPHVDNGGKVFAKMPNKPLDLLVGNCNLST